jgi:hypothetical protein
MDQKQDLKTWTLSLACNRLASHVTALQQKPSEVDHERVYEVNQLVTRALEIIERQGKPSNDPEPPTPAAPPPKGTISSLLFKMLRSGDSTPSAPTSAPASLARRSDDKPPSEKHKLALRVYGQFLPAPDLIGFLSTYHRTGILEVEAPGELFLVEFEEGDIVHAQSNHMPDGQRLGDVLVSKGYIDREALEKARRENPTGRLGEILLGRALVDKTQLLGALQTQIQLLFNRMFEAPTTRFTFWAGPPMRADEKLRLNATSLLLEGARASDEAKWFWTTEG